VTLIKSTLSNLPTYYMSLFPIPVSVASCIEKLQRDFLWGGMGEEFKYHLVSWVKVCTPISKGGLGIRNLVLFNHALLGKWLWRFGMERDAWWRVAVDSKFGSLCGGWCSREIAGAFGVGLWKFIRKGWETFSKFLRFEVGDGSRTRFWHDLWCGDTVLKEVFSDLFGIARVKDASVADNMEILGGSIQWNVSFVREAHDWKVDAFTSFFQVLDSTRVNRDRADCLSWVSSKKGVFPWKSVWRSQAPPKAAFFTWSAALGRILTLDNLRKRHIILVDRCCLCKRDGE
jgi:hypothetical protein